MRIRGQPRVLALAALLTWSACIPIPPPPTPPPAEPLVVVTVDAGQEWTDSRIIVRKGQRLIFWATGEIHVNAQPNRSLGPDGAGGLYYNVGKGGLIGGIDNEKPFTIGARTHLFKRGRKGGGLPFAPPPIEMKRDGTLRLGFKAWKAGAYQGAFVVSIWRVP